MAGQVASAKVLLLTSWLASSKRRMVKLVPVAVSQRLVTTMLPPLAFSPRLDMVEPSSGKGTVKVTVPSGP